MRTARRLDCGGREAERAVPGRGGGGGRSLLGTPPPVHLLHQQEDGESHDEELEHAVNESPVVQRGCAGLLGLRQTRLVRPGKV